MGRTSGLPAVGDGSSGDGQQRGGRASKEHERQGCGGGLWGRIRFGNEPGLIASAHAEQYGSGDAESGGKEAGHLFQFVKGRCEGVRRVPVGRGSG